MLIDVSCSALNFTDHLMLQGRYQDRPALPFTPGLDAAGTISAVGPGVGGFAVGDKVVSSGVVGAYASQLRAPASRLVALPARLALASAVASINSHLTAYHGLVDRAALQAGERVLVLGANGAVGRAAAELASHRGARVLTVERADGGVLLKDLEAATECRAAVADLRRALKDFIGSRGVDVVVDPVGDAFTEPAVRSLAWRGRLLVIGFAAGAIPSIPLNLLLLKGAAVLGVYCGGLLLQEPARFTAQLAEVFALIDRGVLTPSPYETIPVRQFEQAWQRFGASRGRKLLIDFTR